MDVKDDGFFDEPKENEVPKVELNAETPVETEAERVRVVMPSEAAIVKLPFPDKDFDENGRVKKLRGRIVKKLLKCELKYYLPILITVVSIVLLAGLFFGASLKIMIENMERAAATNYEHEVSDEVLLAVLFSGLFYIFCCYGGIFFMQIFPVSRYNKNFFKNEGYLTFSIPASAEEHIAAKRIGAIICSVAAFLAVGVSLFAVLLITGGVEPFFEEFWAIISSLYGLEGFGTHAVFFTVEMVISFLLGIVLTPCLYGAMSCLLSKLTGGWKLIWVIITVVVCVALVEIAYTYVATYGISTWLMTPMGLHIFAWLGILVQAGLIIGCIAYEIHYLKKKLDLK